MKVRVFVTLRHGVHDPAGEAISRALASQGLTDIKNVRASKFFDLEIDGSAAEAERLAKTAAEKLLANTVIEKFWITTNPTE